MNESNPDRHDQTRHDQIVYVRGVPRNDFLAGDKFDWLDVPVWIYPAFRTPEDERNRGERHCGDAVLRGTGCGISYQPGYPGAEDKPWSTYMGSSGTWPGKFPDKESAKRAVEEELVRRQRIAADAGFNQ